MKTKKYLSVIISIALIWLLIALSERIVSDAYNIFMYIAFACILIVLFAYQIKLRISLIKILTHKMNPQQFLAAYQELDGNKYSSDRYIYEALANILTGDFARAENLLKNVNNKNNTLKTDALFILCYYFSGNYTALTNAVSLLKKHFEDKHDSKYEYYLNFAILIDAIASDKPFDPQLTKKYFNSIPKKDIVEVYIASYISGEAKLKLGEFENALTLFEHVINSNCNTTILYSKSKLKIEAIKSLDDSQFENNTVIDEN